VSARVTLGAYCRAKDDEVPVDVSCVRMHGAAVLGGG
jgi:hypothetical protein